MYLSATAVVQFEMYYGGNPVHLGDYHSCRWLWLYVLGWPTQNAYLLDGGATGI
jgi:hypothetical protein